MSACAAIDVVFVEDDPALRDAMCQSLRLEGLSVDGHERATTALKTLSPDFGGVVVSDIRLPGMDGLEFFEAIQEFDPELPVIFTTGHGDVAMAVDAMKQGAADFLTKPYSSAALIAAIRRAAETRALVIENRKLKAQLREREDTGLIGSSDRIRRIEGLVGEVSRTDLDIVLTGPVGTGKSYLAGRIHELSARQGRPFVSIDAGIWTHPDAELIVFGRDPGARASRSGLIERARHGTLLLDNIEAIPPALHGRIGSLFETRTYRTLEADRPRNADVRIIATTRGTAGAANETLLKQLGGIMIALPPLADRREDIPAIFRHFVAEIEAEMNTSARPLGAREWNRLMGSDWPGNIRQLRDFARQFVHGLTDDFDRAALSDTADRSLAAMVFAFERSILVDALARNKGRVQQVEKDLCIKRKTLYDKLTRHGLIAGDFRDTPDSGPTG